MSGILAIESTPAQAFIAFRSFFLYELTGRLAIFELQ
jgi:hypothetical protein